MKKNVATYDEWIKMFDVASFVIFRVSAHSLHCHQMHMIYDHSNSNAINYHTWTLIDAQICFCFPPRLRRRFSQIFIDIREKERKRLQRGLVSVPLKYPKLDEKLLSELTANDTDESTAVNRDDNPSSGFKPEHLLELQEKITKEILGTRLKESEMQELQVSTDAQRSLMWNFVPEYS